MKNAAVIMAVMLAMIAVSGSGGCGGTVSPQNVVAADTAPDGCEDWMLE